MRLKQFIFTKLSLWSKYYRIFKVLAVLQLLVSIGIPVFAPEINSGFWFLSFTLFIFWLSTYALIRLAHHHNPNITGFSGWIQHQWENILFIAWLVIAMAIAIFSLKLLLYIF